MPTEITFIRHAQTTGNAGGRWQGHTNSQLTDLGREQAAKLGARLQDVPFDLVVASVLMSMGMMMLSPMIISLPFKLMLFVLVDGWALIMGTLASSFLLGA